MPRKKVSKARNYIFVINNYTDQDLSDLEKVSKCTWFRFMHFGKEVGEKGTPHLQGYIQLNKAVTLSWIKKHVHPTAHWERAKGSYFDNDKYNSKEHKDFIEYGTPKQAPKDQGQCNCFV